MLARQLELGQRMIKLRRFPAVRVVAVRAAIAQPPGMGVAFAVTRGTILWRGPQRQAVVRIDMALRAVNAYMLAREPEGNFVVIETPAKGLDPVMAGGAIRSKCQAVRQHERGVHLEVAIAARRLIELQQVPVKMAVAAAKRGPIAQPLVGIERKGKRSVWKLLGIQIREGRIPTVMLGVTRSAIDHGERALHPPVQGFDVSHLARDVLVAHQASVRHADGRERRDMTGPAAVSNFRVGRHAPQRCAGQGAQPAGTEHAGAVHDGVSADGQACDQ